MLFDNILFIFIFSVSNELTILECVTGCAVYDIEGCKMLSPLKACHQSPEPEPRVRALAPTPGGS